jgi:hypothetical protein
MKSILSLKNPLMMQCSRPAFIIALTTLLFPAAVWAHTCGPQELAVKIGDTIKYKINGHHVPSFEITEKGDPLVATIEPPVDKNNPNLIFKIIGSGVGITVFQIHWKGPLRENTCSVRVSVSG